MTIIIQSFATRVSTNAESVLTAFHIFLHRYLQQERVVVVFPEPNDATLAVVATQLGARDTFSDIQAQVSAALQNEKINWTPHHDSDTAEEGSRFQVAFHLSHQKIALGKSLVGMIPGVILEIECLCFLPSLEMRWHFNPAWYKADEVQRMADCFDIFLQNLDAAPEKICTQISLLSADEHRKLIVDWNQTDADYSRLATIHGLIESRVDIAPDFYAATFESEQITYSDLDQRANQIAHALRDAGVLPGTPVGLYVDRNLDMLAAQLGILKAGAAYAALDTHYPRELLARLFDVIDLPVILTESKWVDNLPEHKSKTVILDDGDWLNSHPKTRPLIQVSSDSPAFILFTSGSTGIPKGVIHTHCNMVARFQAAWDLAEITAEDVVSQTSPLSSIDGVDEIFSPLMCGARVLMISHQVVTDPHRLVEALENGGVTRIILVPSLLRIILALDEPDLGYRLRHLKTWLIGGEPLTNAISKLFYAKLPEANLINFYGLTEGDALFHRVRSQVDYAVAPPIGRPVQNAKVYLLDDYLGPVPVGVTGEICIASDGMFFEYYHRPDLNEQKWISNPFDPDGPRLFKTGDLGRFTQQGDIEYVGRRDRMVKIRSFRVELGEIESALYRHPSVRECFVAAREVKPAAVRSASLTKQVRLAAYIVLGQPVAEQDLRHFLRGILPDYAMPAVFFFLDKLPLSPNGKVDLNSLPEISDSIEARDDFIAPRNSLEAEISGVWSKILQRHPISMKDNFFDIGGDSLAAVDVVLQLEKKFDRSLPISVLMQSPTVEQLAAVMNDSNQNNWSSLVPIRPQGDQPPLFCVHADGGVLFYYRFAQLLPEKIPIYGLQARGLVVGQRPHTDVIKMAADYIREMQSVQPHGPYHIVAYSLGGMVSLEIANQLLDMGEQVAFLGLLDAYGPEYPRLAAKKNLFSYKLSVHANTMRLRAGSGKIKYLWSRTKKRAGIIFANMFGDIFMAMRLPLPHVVRYNYVSRILNEVVYDHQLKPHPGVVTVFRASTQPENIIPDPSLGWDEYVSGKLKVVEVEGTHNSIMKEPHLPLLVETILHEIDGLRQS